MRKLLNVIALASLVATAGIAQNAQDTPPELAGVGITEKPDAELPLDATFTDSNGEQVRLGDLFDGERPVLLNLVYYRCPMLCGLVLNGVADGMSQMRWTPGDEFQAVAISIDPTETPKLAAAKKETYIKALDRGPIGDGWRFMVGDQESIDRVADALGFRYAYDEENQQYAHTAATFMITPDGHVARYLYGIEYTPKDLKLALLEAGEGKVGNSIDQLIMYCYCYDPDARGYTVQAMNVMRVGGVATVLVLGVFLGLFWVRDRRRKAADDEP